MRDANQMQYVMAAQATMARMGRGVPALETAHRLADTALRWDAYFLWEGFLSWFHHADEADLGPDSPRFSAAARERYARFVWDEARSALPDHFDRR